MNRCRTCGDRYSEFGDGWEGECGNCADLTYLAEERAEDRRYLEGRIDDVRMNMPWSEERDALLDELYEALANVNAL